MSSGVAVRGAERRGLYHLDGDQTSLPSRPGDSPGEQPFRAQPDRDAKRQAATVDQVGNLAGDLPALNGRAAEWSSGSSSGSGPCGLSGRRR